MRLNNKLPKTFSLFIRKNGKEGFLRFESTQSIDGDISYTCHLVPNRSEASKFVTFDNVKKYAHEYAEKYRVDEMKIIDDSLNKTYHVKKQSKKQK